MPKTDKTPISRLRGWWHAARLSRLEIVGLTMLAVVLILTVCGPWIAPHPTEAANSADRLLTPSWKHPFGTDQNGLDVFSRVLASPRTDVLIAIAATLISTVVGCFLGAIAGLFEGNNLRSKAWLSEAILRILDVIQAFPVFIFAMVLVAIRGPGLENIILAAAFVNTPVFLRLVRGELLSLRGRPFAEAARVAGCSDLRIAVRHMLPNALPPVMVQVSVTVGFTILLTAGLSFVGAGVAPPTPELGSMIATGASLMISGQWWPSMFPGIALGLTVFAFGVAGETAGRLLQPGGITRSETFEDPTIQAVLPLGPDAGGVR